jgi:hypothetical protein
MIFRSWLASLRSNASLTGIHPKKIRSDLKAWATRCLKERFDSTRENWWAERGSTRYLNDDRSLEAAVLYVQEAQDRKDQVTRNTAPVTRNISEACSSLTRRVSEGECSP